MKNITDIPFSSELFDLVFSCELTGMLNCVKTRSFSKMSDLLDVSYENFCSWPTAGNRKWELFKEVQQLLNTTEIQEKISKIYDCCICSHEFPENLTIYEEELTLEQKIDIAIKQYVSYLEKISMYKNVNNDLMYIKQIYIDRRSKREIAQEFGISEEAVRQAKVRLMNHMFDGTLHNAENLKFSDSFKQEIEQFLEHLPTVCAKKTLCKILQCENYEESTASVLLKLKSAPSDENSLDNHPYLSFDQLYYIPTNIDIKWAQKHIEGVCDVLGYKVSDVRPMSVDDIMDLLWSSKEADKFEFNRDVVIDILEQHEWIERLVIEDEIRYQLKYEYLKKDYNFFGRIVYEKKRVNINEIDNIHREMLNDTEAKSIRNAKNNAKNKFPWVVFGGVNGIIEYNEQGQSRKKMITAVHEWISRQTLFTMNDMLDALKNMGYSDLHEPTIRTYILENCHRNTKNSNLFCNSEYVEQYSKEYSWRNKSQAGLINWIIRTVHKLLKNVPKHAMSIKDIDKKVKLLAVEEEYVIRNSITTYLYIVMRGKDAIFVINEKNLELTSKGQCLSKEELEVMCLRNRKPDYYDVVISKIISLLSNAVDCEMRLNDLQRECLEDIGDKAVTAFYRIVEKYLPKQIVKIHKDDKAFLKLEQEKIEYVDSLVVKPAEVEDAKDDLIAVKEEVERPIREFGTKVDIDWETLRQDFNFQLNYYSRQWSLDISFKDSVDKFIRFIKNMNPANNSNLTIQLPRNFTQLWHYQNDFYSYLGYMSDIVIYYERLLREIHKANTGITINTSGLHDTIDRIDYIKNWMYKYDNDNFHKIMKSLRYDRNRLAHGEELTNNLSEIIINTSKYIALYIYTVAIFWNENIM